MFNEVDVALSEQSISWPELFQYGSTKDIKQLITAIIQDQDLEKVQAALGKLGYTVTHLPSTGGFLSQRNVTLLIGIPEGQAETAVKALRTICKRRVEFVSSFLPGVSFPAALPTSVTVSGATIFTFEVESYDEF